MPGMGVGVRGEVGPWGSGLFEMERTQALKSARTPKFGGNLITDWLWYLDEFLRL